MTDRHVVTKQRESIKTVIERIEAALAVETNPKDREQLEKYLDYWKREKKHRSKV